MNNIAGFLQKFLNLEKDNDTKLALILEIIKKEAGVEIQKDKLEIKGDNLKIKSNPVVRNEIFIHQPQIESALKSQKIFLKLI